MSIVNFKARLTQEDIQRLMDRENPEVRALAVHKICKRIDEGELIEQDRQAAQDLIRFIATDAAELVRRALAVSMQRSPDLPADVARKLIKDIDSIAIPVLAGSPVLDDSDLIEVIRTGSGIRQSAIAKRPTVSKGVVKEIVVRGQGDAVGTLAANNGAEFDEESFSITLQRFRSQPNVLERFIERRELPLNVTEKLIARISADAIDRLVARHALPPQLAVELAESARERATVDLVEQAGMAPDPRRFVQQLQMNARLTPSLILRALFRGHMAFFEHAIAELAGIEHRRAWLLIHDAGPLGLEAVFDRTGLPKRIFPAIRAAVQAYDSLEMGPSGAEDILKFRTRLMERIFTQFQGAPEADLNYCMERLDGDHERILAINAAS